MGVRGYIWVMKEATRKDRGVEHLSRCPDGLSLEKDEEDSVEKVEGHTQLVPKLFLRMKL